MHDVKKKLSFGLLSIPTLLLTGVSNVSATSLDSSMMNYILSKFNLIEEVSNNENQKTI